MTIIRQNMTNRINAAQIRPMEIYKLKDNRGYVSRNKTIKKKKKNGLFHRSWNDKFLFAQVSVVRSNNNPTFIKS